MSAKYKLKSSRQYSDVFIHRDQTVQQRIERKNFQTIVDVLKSVDPHINMKGAEVIASRYINGKKILKTAVNMGVGDFSYTTKYVDVERTIQHEVTLPTYTVTTTQEQVIGNRTTNTAVETTINSREEVDGSYLQVYEHQNSGPFLICGDFNSRCGDENDYIVGVDDLCQEIKFDMIKQEQSCVNDIFSSFCKTVEGEMNDKLTCKTVCIGGSSLTNKKHRIKKPCGKDDLNKLWVDMCKAEKRGINLIIVHVLELKSVYVQKRKYLTGSNSKCKKVLV
ncbi:unnamed protein product [Mytilus edulis]|uniref:Endonuclease/exonuclease/phosphatase domain-containing protein n=1 Tax=Mytilus edulis TaxID=6550 RepID=A0A8S3QTD1_MYTED|nr:unnamed protein product [Mytilus edulis]